MSESAHFFAFEPFSRYLAMRCTSRPYIAPHRAGRPLLCPLCQGRPRPCPSRFSRSCVFMGISRLSSQARHTYLVRVQYDLTSKVFSPSPLKVCAVHINREMVIQYFLEACTLLLPWYAVAPPAAKPSKASSTACHGTLHGPPLHIMEP